MTTLELARAMTLLGPLGFDLEVARRRYFSTAYHNKSVPEGTGEQQREAARKVEESDLRHYRNMLVRTRDTLSFLRERAVELVDELEGAGGEDTGTDEKGDGNGPETVQP